MRLSDLPAVLLEDLVRTWIRRVIVGIIAFAFALAAVIHSISAARYALQPAVGPAGADLILVGVFLLIIAISVGFLVSAERRDAARKQAPAESKDQKVTMIAEAVSLGYALAQDFRRGGGRTEDTGDPAKRGGSTSQSTSGDPPPGPRPAPP